MKVLYWPRRSGKTTKLALWVKEGERTDSYPGWNRVMLVPTAQEALHVRQQYKLDSHQIFSFDEWRTAYARAFPADARIEVAVDRAETLIHDLVMGRGTVTYAGIEDDTMGDWEAAYA